MRQHITCQILLITSNLSTFRKLCVSIFQLENTDDDDDNYEKFNYPTQAHSHSFLKDNSDNQITIILFLFNTDRNILNWNFACHQAWRPVLRVHHFLYLKTKSVDLCKQCCITAEISPLIKCL